MARSKQACSRRKADLDSDVNTKVSSTVFESRHEAKMGNGTKGTAHTTTDHYSIIQRSSLLRSGIRCMLYCVCRFDSGVFNNDSKRSQRARMNQH